MPFPPFRLHLSSLRLVNISSQASLRALISAMAGTGEDLSSASGSADPVPVNSLSDSQIDGAVVVESPNADEIKYGFQRAEMYKSPLAGTVDPYDRHVFLCFQSPESWPGRVEDPVYDPLVGRLADFVYTRKDDLPLKTRLTICEGKEGTEFSDGDVLIFPDMIKYKDLKYDEVDVFGENVLLRGTTRALTYEKEDVVGENVLTKVSSWDSKLREPLIGSHIFVCAHGSRDRRCGVCGPVLIENFNKEIELRGLKDQIFVRSCSHVGGHKYAGNVIIFSPNSEGKVVGHWYGYVTPDDVPTLLDQHIGKGVIIEQLWRGQMGPLNNEDKQIDEQKLQENSGAAFLEGTNSEKIESQHQGISLGMVNMQDGGGCCQGANGFSCCRDGDAELNSGVAKKKQREGVNVHGKGLDSLSAWMGKWERSDVLAATAVIGAVASVAVAYSYYKRSH